MLFNKIEKEVNSIIILEKRGEFKEAIELREKINMKNKNVLQLLSIRDSLSGINYTIRNIHNTKKYTSDEKRELIDIQYLLMIKTAKRGLDYMNLKVDKQNER